MFLKTRLKIPFLCQKNPIYNETTLQEDDTTIIGGTLAPLHEEPVSPTMDR